VAAVPSGQAHDDLTGGLTTPQDHPLLIHFTSGDSFRGAMGLEFAETMLKSGHPVAVFLLAELGLKLDQIVAGVQLSRPGYLENFVFADNVRTLTW